MDCLDEIDRFVEAVKTGPFSDAHKTWMFDYAIIRLYREFESLILSCVIAAINNDTAQLSAKTGVSFPKHLTDEVCEYIIAGDSYFDFRGRDGLIRTCKQFLSDNHYFITKIKKAAYQDSLERLSALRNFAAHDSKQQRNGL